MSKLKETWDGVFKEKKWGQYPAEDLVRFFSKYKTIYKKNLLEIGCGPGGNANFFINEKLIYTGIDISTVAINKAKKKYKNIPNLNFINHDFTNYKFDENKFHYLIDNCSSCCLPLKDRILFYENISNSIKKNGVIFMRTFSNKCILSKTKKISANEFYEPKKILNNVGKINFLNETNAKKIFRKNFKIHFFEEITRSVDNKKFTISEWIIHAKKK